MQLKTTAVIQQYGNREQFLKAFNPSLQIAVARHPQRAFFGKAPSLAVIRHAYGHNAPTMWIIAQLYDLCEYTGAKKMDAQQATMLAEVIAQEYGYLKVSELLLFFFRFKAGCYGRFFGAVDPMVITTAIKAFMEERMEAHRQHEQQQQQHEQEEIDKTEKISWQQYADKYGIDEPNPLAFFTIQKDI